MTAQQFIPVRQNMDSEKATLRRGRRFATGILLDSVPDALRLRCVDSHGMGVVVKVKLLRLSASVSKSWT